MAHHLPSIRGFLQHGLLPELLWHRQQTQRSEEIVWFLEHSYGIPALNGKRRASVSMMCMFGRVCINSLAGDAMFNILKITAGLESRWLHKINDGSKRIMKICIQYIHALSTLHVSYGWLLILILLDPLWTTSASLRRNKLILDLWSCMAGGGMRACALCCGSDHYEGNAWCVHSPVPP